MRRHFLFPLLAVALLATEAAQAQTAPTTPAGHQAYRKVRKAERVLSKREQQAADAALRVQAARAAAATPVQAGTTWSGWSNDPLPLTPAPAAPNRAVGNNLSVAPGIPLNQLGHGVSTDYNGRPLATPVASTTLPGVR